MASGHASITWRNLVSRTALFLFMWWALTDGSTSSWQIGVPAVLLATVTSIALIPPSSLVWLELLRFVPFFLFRSLLGGMDVAWRAFHPRMPIAPDLVEYQLRLPPGLARVFMANTVTLLPGTLSASIDDDVLRVHVLNQHLGLLDELEAAERRVARVFAVPYELSQKTSPMNKNPNEREE